MMLAMNTQKNNEQGITLDRLAEIVMAEFIDFKQDVTGKFKSVENRIQGVENVLNSRVDGVELKINNIDYRVDKLEQKMDARFDELGYRIDGLAVDKVSYEEHNKLLKKLALQNVL